MTLENWTIGSKVRDLLKFLWIFSLKYPPPRGESIPPRRKPLHRLDGFCLHFPSPKTNIIPDWDAVFYTAWCRGIYSSAKLYLTLRPDIAQNLLQGYIFLHSSRNISVTIISKKMNFSKNCDIYRTCGQNYGNYSRIQSKKRELFHHKCAHILKNIYPWSSIMEKTLEM